MPIWGWIIVVVLALIVLVLIGMVLSLGRIAGGLLDAFSGGALGILKRKRR